MSTSYGRRLRLRLFLEGIEVPVISANVQCAPNGPIVCSIQIPPLPEGTRFLPRTLVHLFFLDDYETKLPHLIDASKRQNTGGLDPTQHQRDMDVSQGLVEAAESTLVHYKLLFGGEIVGFVWNKNPSSRSLVLQCLDWSNYWDYAYQFENTGIFGPGRHARFSGGATNMFTDFLRSKSSVIAGVLSTGRSANFPELKGMAAGIIRLMEMVGGTYYPPPGSKAGRISGQNLFFSTAELRLHITHMVAAFEKDPTTANLLRRAGFMGLFNRALGGLGSQVSIRKIMNAMQGVIFHEVYPQPCPYFKPGKTVEPKATRHSIASGKHGDFAATSAGVATTLKSLAAQARAAETAAALGQLTDDASRETREDIVNSLNTIVGTVRRLISNSPDAPSAALKYLKTTDTMIDGKGSSSALSIANAWRPLKPSNHLVLTLERAAAEMAKIGKITVEGRTRGYSQAARLNQQILRPDIWFGAPPRCNVLFPEDYSSLSYQRMFLQEPTRLLLKTNDEFFGEDFLFDRLYFAPQAGTVKKDQARLRDVMNGAVLNHELFTGILPVFEKAGEFNVFASRSKVIGDSDSLPQSVKDGFAQRSASFLYFKYRFNARQMSIAGKFNPYLAVGFPGLIIDKYVDLQTIVLHNQLREKGDLPALKISESLGTNFLGNFTEITHSISQESGQGGTTIQCSYPRQPEETVEFLGIEDIDDVVRRQVDGGSVRATDVAALNPPKINSLGPNGGVIKNVTDVTDVHDLDSRFFGADLEDVGASSGARKLPLFTAKTKGEGRTHTVLVPIGVPVTGRELNSPDVTEVAGTDTTPVAFRAFRIEEEVPRFKREKAGEKSFESLVHPGWYGDIWRPNQIGQVYYDFFGTGAITDPQTLNDGTLRVTVPGDEELAAASDAAATAESSEDPVANLLSFLSLDKNSTIRDAVDFLVLTYSYIRQNNLNVDAFIRSYTWRPIATMADIFGSTDLEFSSDGERVTSGVEGFHSRAFGPYENLFGLASPEIKSILGIKEDTVAAQRADTRKRKQEQVQQYTSALLFSRGILG